MKPEKEVLWIVNLLKSRFVKRKFGGSIGGCKSDFEKVARASENNKDFRGWIDKLIEEGSIEFFERKRVIGKSVNTYVVNSRRLVKRLKNTEFYNSMKEIVLNEETFIGI